MKKRLLSIAAVLALVFAMAACADSGKEYVTAEDYRMLLDKPYSGMTLDEVNKAIGMDGTLERKAQNLTMMAAKSINGKERTERANLRLPSLKREVLPA